MKKFSYLLVSFAMICTFITVGFQQTEAAPQKVIAVGHFTSSTNSRFGSLVRSQVETSVLNALVQNKRYIVVERGALDQIFRELGLQNSGVVDGSTAIEIGKLSGADYTMLGNITAAEVSENFMGNKATVSFEIRIVDNKTGVVLSSNMISASKKGPMFSSSYSAQRALLSDAAAEAAGKIAAEMNNIDPLVGTVCEIDRQKKLVYFDLGTDDGVNVNDTYKIYAEKKFIKHPSTGEILGVSEDELAEVKVTEVKPGLSTAKIKKTTGSFKVGDKIKQVVRHTDD